MRIFLSPSTILGSSAGLSGSTASLTTGTELKERGRKMAASWLPLAEVSVAVLLMGWSTPSSSTQLPARARVSSMR